MHSLPKKEFNEQFVVRIYELANQFNRMEEIVEWSCLKRSFISKMSILLQLLISDKHSKLALKVALSLICLSGHEPNLVKY